MKKRIHPIPSAGRKKPAKKQRAGSLRGLKKVRCANCCGCGGCGGLLFK